MKYKILTKEYLIQKYYIEQLSTHQIAKVLNIPQCTIYWYMDKYNIKKRTLSQAHKGKKLSKKHILNLSGKNSGRYIDGRSTYQHYCIEPNCNNEITYQGALYGSGRCESCARRIQNTGRKVSEETKRKMSEVSKGENHWNWQGGISSLGNRIHNLLEYKQWRQKVFERGFFTCQECIYKGHDIEAHHIKQFAEIFKEFLKEYDQFSPIEDKETLVRLATKWVDFWDIDNGKTLCKDCHNKSKVRRIKCPNRREDFLRN